MPKKISESASLRLFIFYSYAAAVTVTAHVATLPSIVAFTSVDPIFKPLITPFMFEATVLSVTDHATSLVASAGNTVCTNVTVSPTANSKVDLSSVIEVASITLGRRFY